MRGNFKQGSFELKITKSTTDETKTQKGDNRNHAITPHSQKCYLAGDTYLWGYIRHLKQGTYPDVNGSIFDRSSWLLCRTESQPPITSPTLRLHKVSPLESDLPAPWISKRALCRLDKGSYTDHKLYRQPLNLMNKHFASRGSFTYENGNKLGQVSFFRAAATGCLRFI